jgi:tRNA uridine 5-carboxymethylaminomethyl modification enzyme
LLKHDSEYVRAFELLRYPKVSTQELKRALPELNNVDPQLLARIDIDGVYEPHLRRQESDLAVFHDDETLVLDPQMDYSTVAGLSEEVKERLNLVKPTSIVSLRAFLSPVFKCLNSFIGCC